MENNIEVKHKYVVRRESKFNDAVFLKNKDMYHVSVIGGTDAVSAAHNVNWNVRMPESVGKYIDDELATLLCNSTAYKDGPQYEAHQYWNRVTATYSGLIIIDIADEKLSSKCKLLGIEKRVVLSYEIYVTRWCPCGTTVSQEISCSIYNHGDIDDGILDAFKSRAVTLK